MGVTVTTTVDFENVELTASAVVKRDEFGWDIRDIQLEGVSIFGVPVDHATLPAKLRTDMLSLAKHADFVGAM